MKKSKIIYDIREKLKLNSDDIDITNDYISYLIDVKRALLIKQRFINLSKNMPESLIQKLCLKTQPISIEGNCFSNILESNVEIPNFVEAHNKDAILSINLYDFKAVPINIIPYERIPYIGYNKWIKNQVYASLHNKKIYLFSNIAEFKLLKYFTITGVFLEPEEADKFNCESTTNCEYIDKEYHINGSIVSDLINMVIKELSPSLAIQEDKLNNADESPR